LGIAVAVGIGVAVSTCVGASVGSDVAVETGAIVAVVEETELLPHAERMNANIKRIDQ